MNFLKTNDKIVKINEVLTSANHKCWLVGGAVRDYLCDKTPNDYDLVTSADPETAMKLFTDAGIKNFPMGINHGTFVIEIENERFEITSSHHYVNGNIIYTSNIEDDLAHRDFTINAMAMDFNGNIIDPFNGQHDLGNGIVRFVGNPIDRITEDPLRMIRFFRFDHTFRKYEESDSDSYDVIVKNVHLLGDVSGWRLWNELSKCLISKHSEAIIGDLRGIDILWEIGISSGDYYGDVSDFKHQNPHDSFVKYLHYSLGEGDEVLEKMMKKFEWTSRQKSRARIIYDVISNGPSLPRLKSKIAAHNYPKKWVIEALDLMEFTDEKKKIEKWNIPVFPISETEVDSEKYAMMKCEWAESGFRLSREKLLNKVL